MKITKLGHSCFLVEERGVRLLTDPGNLSTAQDNLTGVDIILITHEHQDHLSLDSLKRVLARNPRAVILTNRGVGNFLGRGKINYTLVEDGGKFVFKEVLIEGFGKDHAVIYPTLPPVANTGYFIANRLFYPGDAFIHPGKPVEILALPAIAPWSKIEETIDYAKEINPKICFGVHEGILAHPDFVPRLIGGILESQGVKFIPLKIGETTDF